MASFEQRVEQLPFLGIGISTEYGAARTPGALQPQAPDEHATLQQAGMVQVGPAAAEGSLLPYPEHDWTVAPDSAIISDQDATPDQIASWQRNGSAPQPSPPIPTPVHRGRGALGSGTS